MRKIFLSHSSNDKSFVEPIAELLGKHHSVYDKFTFEIGGQTIREIFENLEDTDIFVYFISDSALNSDWVRRELNKAVELLQSDKYKLSQIFPIIIDDNIRYTDDRIASFLRNDYNLQRVDNATIAYRKIIQQISKMEFEKDINYTSSHNFFYGRDEEVKKFKQRIDNLLEPCLKSVIVSGVPGIGKKSFLKYALRKAKIVKEYYEPIIISMSKHENIEDLIVSISDAGFGNYDLKQIANMTSMDEKIDILATLLNKIQRYKEIIIVEDDECLIEGNGNVRYWFYNALVKSENGIAVVVTSNCILDRFTQRNYPDICAITLLELEPSDSTGLLRTYSQQQNIEFCREDLEYLKDCLSGYPLQILFCVDLAKNESVDFVKENTHLITEMPEQISSSILDKCKGDYDEKDFWGILAVIAKLDLAPIKLINQICKIKQEYRNIILSLKKYSVCYTIGSANEYLKMNSFIRSYVTRNKAIIPVDIQDLLHTELNNFNEKLDKDSDLALWDMSELKYFIKENLVNGISISENFIYSTIILQTAIELYHKQHYSKTIDIINETKKNDRLQYFDDSVIVTLQRYLCQSLSKNHDPDFASEVQFFAERNQWVDYYFLKGFNCRCNELYEQAEVCFNKVLERKPNHLATKRELVIVYLSLQDFDSAMVLAKSNYHRNRDNLFALQAYFECLLEQKSLDEHQNQELYEMLNSIKRMHRISPTPVYYQLMAKYEFYLNDSLSRAMKYIESGLAKYHNHMYILRDKFDLYRKAKNISGMHNALTELEKAVTSLKYKGIYFTRKAILDLFEGKTEQSVRIYLQTECNFSNKTIENILRKAI